MTYKILLLGLIITPCLWAQEASEEAIILNQELQFLEESVSNLKGIQPSNSQNESTVSEIENLEKEYFGNDLADDISTRTSAPKRRSY